jgi:hypothetical protein
MNREQIIQMAREAGIRFRRDVFHSGYCDGVHGDELEAFAKLVAEHERSECAKVCEKLSIDMEQMPAWAAKTCANQIRERGQT